MKKLHILLSSMLKIGLIGFGGGNALIPVIEQEMVENCKLIKKEEYDEVVLVGNITPGALVIKVASGIGKIVSGTKGMFLAAATVSLPGVLIMLLLLAGMSSADAELLKQIEIVFIGIAAFILFMLTEYIRKTYDWAKEKKRVPIAILIISVVFVLSMGKSACQVLEVFGIKASSYFSISTVQILIMTFFVMGYVGSRLSTLRVMIAGAICVLYSLLICKGELLNFLIQNDVSYRILLVILRITMFVLAMWGIVGDKKQKIRIQKISLRELIKEEVILFTILLFFSIPALVIIPDFFHYLVNGFISCIVSFGGGSAYLTVADGFFVAEGMISESDFYGRLVTVVNILPGSVLGKMLPGVGYYVGYNYGGIETGIIAVLAGFVCSITGSCSVVLLVQNLFQVFNQIKAFQVLKNWIKVVISGLLGTVILSMICQCLNVASAYNCHSIVVLAELVGIYSINIWLDKKYNYGTWVSVIVSSILALCIGNVIM